jgi:thymidylate synthase (FAD)
MDSNNHIGVLDKGYVRLVDTMGNDLSIINAARVSFDKESSEFSEKDASLLTYLIKNHHTSPLRHAALTFEVYMPLIVARQWYKHTIAATFVDDQNGWNESSRRYVTENEEFYIPKRDEWRLAASNKKQGSSGLVDPLNGSVWTEQLEQYVDQGLSLYEEALDQGLAPEQARLFLPAYGLYVRARWTVSLAAVVHFLEQRLDSHAQWEIVQYAKAVEQFVSEAFPHTYNAIQLASA